MGLELIANAGAVGNTTATSINDYVNDVIQNQQIPEMVLPIIMMVCALPICFFGAKLFKATVGVLGFLLGAYGSFLALDAMKEYIGELSISVGMIIICVCGVIAAATLVCLYSFSVFTVGALGGGLLANMIYVIVIGNMEYPDYLYVRIPAIMVVALIGGLLAIKFMEIVLKAVTPFVGGYMLVAGVDYFGRAAFGWWRTSPFDPSPKGSFFGHPEKALREEPAHVGGLLGLWAVLVVLGLCVQYRQKDKKHVGSRYRRASPRERQFDGVSTGRPYRGG
jgi:hypothetical protein